VQATIASAGLKDSPVEAFAEADRHPVFELTPAGADRQPATPDADRVTVACRGTRIRARSQGVSSAELARWPGGYGFRPGGLGDAGPDYP
jgi:hypothetical protein